MYCGACNSTENSETVLEWHQRHAIALGTAKGLRFLHEECRGGPIIHRDMRPSNILLTHDFVPMVKIIFPCNLLISSFPLDIPQILHEMIVSLLYTAR